jgi:hypothetical protein
MISYLNSKACTLLLGLALSTAVGCSGVPDSTDTLEGESASAAVESLTASPFRVSLTTSRNLTGGQRASLYFRVRSAQGRPVTSFDVEHTKLFHLIIVSRDLSSFTHIHPSYLGGGRFGVNWTPPSFDDEYYVYSQFKPARTDMQTVLLPLHVPGLSIKTPAPVVADTVDTKRSGPNALEIVRPAGGFAVGKQMLHFMVRDARTGDVVDDLGTFLGARAHIIAVRAAADGKVFEHGHDMGMPGMDMGHMPGMDMDSGAPSGSGHLSFDLNLEAAGTYRLWIQYNRAGADVTQSFTIDVGGGATACNFSEPGMSYVGKSPDECSRIRFMCVAGTTMFENACGCGCATMPMGGTHDSH